MPDRIGEESGFRSSEYDEAMGHMEPPIIFSGSQVMISGKNRAQHQGEHDHENKGYDALDDIPHGQAQFLRSRAFEHKDGHGPWAGSERPSAG